MFDTTVSMGGVSAVMFYDPANRAYAATVIGKDGRQKTFSDTNPKFVFEQMRPLAGDKVALITARKFFQTVGKETGLIRTQRNSFLKEHKNEFEKIKAALKRQSEAAKAKAKKSPTKKTKK